jgi:diadenosine tetraphosphate (Ap4A) HIT family hydrolase
MFCRVVAQLREADQCPTAGAPDERYRKIVDLPASIAILAPDQFHRGYSLVVAKVHATELFELSEAEATQYYHDMVRVARAVAAAFCPRKLNYELLGNMVPHLHWHVLPRYADDANPRHPAWQQPHPPRILAEEAYVETIAAIRQHLGPH